MVQPSNSIWDFRLLALQMPKNFRMLVLYRLETCLNIMSLRCFTSPYSPNLKARSRLKSGESETPNRKTLPPPSVAVYVQEWERETGVVVSTKTMSRMLV
jgi:hypothetical protein